MPGVGVSATVPSSRCGPGHGRHARRDGRVATNAVEVVSVEHRSQTQTRSAGDMSRRISGLSASCSRAPGNRSRHVQFRHQFGCPLAGPDDQRALLERSTGLPVIDGEARDPPRRELEDQRDDQRVGHPGSREIHVEPEGQQDDDDDPDADGADRSTHLLDPGQVLRRVQTERVEDTDPQSSGNDHPDRVVPARQRVESQRMRGKQRRGEAEDVDEGEREADQSVAPERSDPGLDDGRSLDDGLQLRLDR